ncbi:endoribonuclease L-PSP [Magnetococcus marinus MC-1]|uniref:Endoribonuclease L-PSP n=1 Tax=Magnetococcus marinus (strain ATCC BAA-1437 / JCM 17883 / MC-1) TaxID=156889 RepID=A0L488_MAGMM|nr:Rid family detoxifying hydrolase [Magnetococcus marinus]ABK42781.1 endoribonuclease L-PSP [Magnetococcus marinus MC-1]
MHQKIAIATPHAPQAIGPYSQAIQQNGWLYISGQIALDPTTGVVVGQGDVGAETHRVMQNLAAILEAAGGGFKDVVKCQIFLADMDDFATVNEIYASYLSEPFPARATVQVAKLPKGVKVEIDATAFVGG